VPTAEVEAADFKIDDRKADDKKEEAKDDGGYGSWGGALPDSMDTGEPLPAPELGPPPCPEGQGRMESGDCAPDEEFFGEQEALDAKSIAQMQEAPDAKAQAKAQEKFYEQQVRQTEHVEKDLDEIIKGLKKRKKSRGKLDDPFNDGGKKEGL
jgi:hypothetical protein